MDEQCLPHARGLRHVDCLVGRHVTAPRVVLVGPRERRLADEQVGVSGHLHECIVRAGVAGIDEAAARPVGDLHPPGWDVVAAADEPDLQVADGQSGSRLVVADLERVVEEGRPLADGGREIDHVVLAARWQVDREALVEPVAPREQVAQPNDIDVVIGVEVANDDRVEPPRVHPALESRDHALAAVEEQPRVVQFDEEPGGGGVGLGLGGSAADDRQAHETGPQDFGIGGSWSTRHRRVQPMARRSPCHRADKSL